MELKIPQLVLGNEHSRMGMGLEKSCHRVGGSIPVRGHLFAEFILPLYNSGTVARIDFFEMYKNGNNANIDIKGFIS